MQETQPLKKLLDGVEQLDTAAVRRHIAALENKCRVLRCLLVAAQRAKRHANRVVDDGTERKVPK